MSNSTTAIDPVEQARERVEREWAESSERLRKRRVRDNAIWPALALGFGALQSGALLAITYFYFETSTALVIDAAPFIVIAIAVVLGFRLTAAVGMLVLTIVMAMLGEEL